jgi:N-methylhydantoinase A/oxoprolinase/acetone carboxylase beta subunit
MGTTLATNALLERGGCQCVLVADEGLGDLIRLGDQTRPELFALEIEKPEPLPDAVDRSFTLSIQKRSARRSRGRETVASNRWLSH